MACNCTKNGKLKYVYVDGGGQQHTYQTEIEAQAAKIRAGGVGTVRAVSK